MPTSKLTPFMGSKDEWDTKEGPGKSMKNALYVQQHDKRHLLTLNSEKIKPVALAIVKLPGLKASGRQGRQAVS